MDGLSGVNSFNEFFLRYFVNNLITLGVVGTVGLIMFRLIRGRRKSKPKRDEFEE